jgi:hypothetical protein
MVTPFVLRGSYSARLIEDTHRCRPLFGCGDQVGTRGAETGLAQEQVSFWRADSERSHTELARRRSLPECMRRKHGWNL